MKTIISHAYLFFRIAKGNWDAVKENYSEFESTSQIFEIKMRLKESRQGKQDVTSYYNILKVLWQELDIFH